jgi:hypothetical protein
MKTITQKRLIESATQAAKKAGYIIESKIKNNSMFYRLAQDIENKIFDINGEKYAIESIELGDSENNIYFTGSNDFSLRLTLNRNYLDVTAISSYHDNEVNDTFSVYDYTDLNNTVNAFLQSYDLISFLDLDESDE